MDFFFFLERISIFSNRNSPEYQHTDRIEVPIYIRDIDVDKIYWHKKYIEQFQY